MQELANTGKRSTIKQAAVDVWRKGSMDTLHGNGGITGGLKSTYEGIIAMSMEAVLKVGMRFYAYNTFKEFFEEQIGKDRVILTKIGAGMGAGFVESMLIVIPCELLKVRHMTVESHVSFGRVMSDVIKEEGFTGLYKGGTATLLRQMSNQMIRFPVFFQATEWVKNWKEMEKDEHLSTSWNMFLGGIAGMTSTLANTPMDVLKTIGQSSSGKNTTFSQAAVEVYQKGGVTAFWSGCVPRMVRVIPGQCITFAVFQRVHGWLTKE